MFVAQTSKRLQLLRFAMVIALASRVGAATIRDTRESEAFVSYLQNASDELNYIGGHLYGQAERAGQAGPPVIDAIPVRYTCSDLTTVLPTLNAADPAGTRCDTYEALFESDLPELERKVMRLVLSALPQRQAAQFLRSARSGNLLGAAWHFLKLAEAAADGFHRGAAVYRSSQEILAITILAAARAHEQTRTGEVQCADAPPLSEGIRTVEDAARCLGLSPNDLFENPREADVRFPRNIGDPPFQALYEIVRTSCGLLPIEVGLNSDPAKRAARQAQCAQLEFRPRLRYGGRTTWETPATPAAQPPGNSTQPKE